VLPTTNYALECGPHQLVDVDADEYGRYIALLDNSEVCTAMWRIRLPFTFEYPLIRELDEERFLIVETRQLTTDNGHIFTTTGQRLLSFNAGDGVEDVLIQASRIVISYFDEGVLGGTKPASDGLAVFNFTGQQVFGFNASQPHFILDCYCMCRQGKDSMLAYTYTDFVLWEICLTNYRVSQLATPVDVEGATALTTFQKDIVFYSSHAYKTSFLWWDRKTRVRHLPAPQASLRGIGNGKFLTHDAAGFSIINAGALLS
jgi:hypothetical protein